jgi:hypothetical protein
MPSLPVPVGVDVLAAFYGRRIRFPTTLENEIINFDRLVALLTNDPPDCGR